MSVRSPSAGCLSLAACVLAAACAPSGDTREQLRKSGRARVGYANEAPYAYMDSRLRKLSGEAPGIARIILGRMGVSSVEGVLTEFGTLIPGLKAHRFDLIAAGMYITPLRCKQVVFSNPTYAIGEAFIVRRGNPKQLHGYEDVARQASVTLGVVSGAIERRYARDMGIPTSRIVIFPDGPSALAGVETGRIDAFAATTLTAGDLMHRAAAAGTTGIELAAPFDNPVINGRPVVGYGAFAFRKGDEALVAEFNRYLGEFIGSPEHLALVEPLGFSEATLPGDVTAEQLCAGRLPR